MSRRLARPSALAGLAFATVMSLTFFVVGSVLSSVAARRPPPPVTTGLCAIPHVGASDCRGAR